MPMLRVYVDTSVFGGLFDEAFRVNSETFFALVRSRRIAIAISDVVEEELIDAPKRVRDFFSGMDQILLERIHIDERALSL